LKTSLRNNSGMALIVAMIAITVLSILAAAFEISMKTETKLAQNADSEVDLLWLGRSGVEYARWILAQQASIAGEAYDSLNQVWAGGPGGPSETNSVLAGVSLDNYHVGDGVVSIKIVDLERRVNINTANGPMIQQALTLMGVDADQISVVSDSIQDWVQSGESPRLAGAKSDYYQTLSPPYYCKEAPMDDLSELLLVKGVTPEMYFGTSATNHAPSKFSHKLGFGNAPGDTPSYPFGLRDIFTPISLGKININTADTNVLQMIPGVDAQAAANIIQQRAGPDGADGTDDDVPIRNPSSALQQAGVTAQGGANVCTTRSNTFEVHVTARVGDYTREYIATLFRNSVTDIRVLTFYWR